MIVCVPTIKSSGPNVKICGSINIYMDFGFRMVDKNQGVTKFTSGDNYT